MSKQTHWYCSECGDGPFLIANNDYCPNCYHKKCDYCHEETIYPKYSRSGSNVGTSSSTLLALNGIPPLDTRDALGSTGNAGNTALNNITSRGVVVNSRHESRGTTISAHNHVRFGGPADGGDVIYQWRCCSCWGVNSYQYDQGCSFCSNHWRCDGCNVSATKV